MSDGGTYEIDIPIKGAPAVDAAAASIDTLAARLDTASKAAKSMADDVKASDVAYAQAQATFDKASKAVEKIGLAADAQRGKMKAAMDAGDAASFWRAAAAVEKLEIAQAGAASAAERAKSALDGEAAKLDALKAKAEETAEAEKKAAQELEDAKEAAGSGKANEAAEAFGKLGGPIGRLGQMAFGAKAGVEKLFASLGSSAGPLLAAVGIAAVVAALALATVAFAHAAVAVASWVVEMADANGTNLRLSQGIAQSVAGGEQLADTIYQLGAQVPLTSGELQQMASQLAATGLQGDELSSALQDAAVKAAKLKYGPDFEKQTNSLSSLSARFHDNLVRTFGLNADGLLAGFGKLVALFDSTQTSGVAIRKVFSDLFQPILDGVAAFVPKVERAFIQLEILALKGLTAIKPLGSTFEKWVGYLEPVWTGIKAIAAVIGVVVGIAAALAAAIIVPFVAANVAVVYAIGKIVEFGEYIWSSAIGALDAFHSMWDTIVGFFQGLSLTDMGAKLIEGLVTGITSGAASVVSSVTGAVGGAIDAAKNLLQINSPSKVFAAIGMSTTEGMAGGVDEGAGDVRTSIESMVQPPETPLERAGRPAPAQKESPSAKPSGGGANFSGAQFIFQGVKDAEDAVGRLEEMLLEFMEGNVAQLGRGVPSGG